MSRLSLRLRVFLFFGLLGVGGIAIAAAGLGLGYRQLGQPAALSAFVTSGLAIGFGLLALTTFVWRLFDDHISIPVERLAAQFRLRASLGSASDLDPAYAKYLGDLAPAATHLSNLLGQAEDRSARALAQRTQTLDRRCAQLVRILSDIPVAVIVASADHKIVLYDGQAADLMAAQAPARLGALVSDYLDLDPVRDALAQIGPDTPGRHPLTVTGLSGAVYTGHIRQFGADQGYTLMLDPLAPHAPRPLVYDFDLLDQDPGTDLLDTPLSQLPFVVFDTETTGLDPQRDAVVQIGAVRVLNSKIIAGEQFETLVNPGRPIPAASAAVHHITDQSVAKAPDFATASAAFHLYAKDAVLVAHNAPFDMAFLHRQAQLGGPAWDHPILDTVHLSAVVFGGSAEHTLDAICARLNIQIPEDQRHTALGDARATAQALVAMLRVLDQRGLHRFGQLRDQMRRHRRILALADDMRPVAPKPPNA